MIPIKFKEQFPGVRELPTLDEINACDPRRLDASWKKYFDDERAAFYAAPNDKPFRMAILSRIVTEHASRGGDAPAIVLKALELLAKEDAGFYAPKTAKGDDAKDAGPSTFTFGLDRAQQE